MMEQYPGYQSNMKNGESVTTNVTPVKVRDPQGRILDGFDVGPVIKIGGKADKSYTFA